MKTVSVTMLAAMEWAKENGGKLKRFPGGYWKPDESFRESVATPTINALVARGMATFTDHREGRNGRFPVEITLKE